MGTAGIPGETAVMGTTRPQSRRGKLPWNVLSRKPPQNF